MPKCMLCAPHFFLFQIMKQLQLSTFQRFHVQNPLRIAKKPGHKNWISIQRTFILFLEFGLPNVKFEPKNRVCFSIILSDKSLIIIGEDRLHFGPSVIRPGILTPRATSHWKSVQFRQNKLYNPFGSRLQIEQTSKSIKIESHSIWDKTSSRTTQSTFGTVFPCQYVFFSVVVVVLFAYVVPPFAVYCVFVLHIFSSFLG